MVGWLLLLLTNNYKCQWIHDECNFHTIKCCLIFSWTIWRYLPNWSYQSCILKFLFKGGKKGFCSLRPKGKNQIKTVKCQLEGEKNNYIKYLCSCFYPYVLILSQTFTDFIIIYWKFADFILVKHVKWNYFVFFLLINHSPFLMLKITFWNWTLTEKTAEKYNWK